MGPKWPENGSFRLILHVLHISSPDLADELTLLSRLFGHQDRHKISNDDVKNDDVKNILDIKFLISSKKNILFGETLTRVIQCRKPFLALTKVSTS